MDLYCSIYVYGRLPFEEMVGRLATMVDGAVTLRTVEGSDLVIDVVENDEFDEDRSGGGGGDFVYFPYLLEVEPATSDGDAAAFRSAVARVLEALRAEGFDFVTAADFEEELPDLGRSRPGPLP